MHYSMQTMHANINTYAHIQKVDIYYIYNNNILWYKLIPLRHVNNVGTIENCKGITSSAAKELVVCLGLLNLMKLSLIRVFLQTILIPNLFIYFTFKDFFLHFVFQT